MMLADWTRDQVKRWYRAWAGPDPHARPQGVVFHSLSTTWRTSRSLYRRWLRARQPILLMIDGPARLTGCGSITGWVLARSARIVSIQALVGQKLIAETVPNFQRRDAHAAYPFYPQQQLAGFRLCPSPGLLPDGVHTVRVLAIDCEGNRVEVEIPLIVDRFTIADQPDLVPEFTGTNREYQQWLRHHDQHDLPELHQGPVMSVAMPIFQPRLDHLLEAIDSVRRQTYPHWELCLCDDGTGDPYLTQHLETLTRTDPRIKLATRSQNQGISAATNQAIAQCTGDYIALLDQDDRLHPQALQALAVSTLESPVDVLYTDEDRIDARGRRLEPFFKPGWSPDLLHSMMYLGHLVAYRRNTLLQAGPCNSQFDGTQDWELALRVTGQLGCRVKHVPGVFYHWRLGGHSAQEENNRRCHERGRDAVEASLHRQGKKYRVENGPRRCTFHLRPSLDTPRVSILIPTKDQPALLDRCLSSIRQRTDYPDLEIIVIDNGSSDPAMLSYLDQCHADRVLRIDEPFNHSLLNNRAAQLATGEFLLLLNDDTEVLSSSWLSSMVEQGMRNDVGAVGAWLIYPDGQTQHAGIVLEESAVARPLSTALMQDGLDRGLSLLTREVSAVTGACLLVRRTLYFSSGGLDEQCLPTSYNDVDFCLRLRQLGYRIMQAPQAKLIHHESASRRIDQRDDGYRAIMRQRWAEQLRNEYFWNPHLGHSSDWFRGLRLHWTAG